MQAYIARTPNVSKKELERRQKECRGDQRLRIEARFGRNVRSLRKQRHLTQEELAALCHVHQHYISDIERGVRNVSLRVVGTIARALGVHEKDLL
ncbi:helix-turn-helix domain-containing protein [Longicatena caecimuris]|uniref:helix-turn-helix domain-containing protein n=1 Tax=Longicatena caecimuris TaxID=1796635 RepID=UPI001D06A25F|nr:helix-turn-helix transcriptional regulator [Longicatena caecimuris]MCB7330686.1 helix-turn-helix domain-containing protein [Longicatena caecimuris]MCB7339063.1 helix-turn-helix domain-containing protein [Longicatena caecimuris]